MVDAIQPIKRIKLSSWHIAGDEECCVDAVTPFWVVVLAVDTLDGALLAVEFNTSVVLRVVVCVLEREDL
jgi:hypothetical protein